jgi:UDP:flavonoid glycosyltransferase YjiC (YdhE family)
MFDAIVTAPGSLGDVNPMLAIARSLKASGMEVAFAAAQRYLPLAERAGLTTHPLTSEAEFDRLVGNPAIWHPRRGARLILHDAVVDFLERHYAWLEQHCVPGKTLLVSHLLDFAGRIYRDRHPDTSMATVVLAPAMLRSLDQPPRVSSFGFERSLPRWLMPLAYRCADWYVDRLAGPPVNGLRKSVGLPPVKRLLKDWWFAPDLVLGMFPGWFSVPARDLPPNFVHAGFPLADSVELVPEAVRQEVESALAASGPSPVVFAPGTAHHHARQFLEIAARVCERLGRGAILLSPEANQLPAPLPQRVVAAKYLPFSLLLPRAGAIVHHGGVGTTSQALAAGLPQVVLPMAFDQFDNAERVQRLGCGKWLPMRQLNQWRLQAMLEAAPNHLAIGEAAARMSSQTGSESWLGRVTGLQKHP